MEKEQVIPHQIHHVWPGEDPFRHTFHAWRLSWMHYHPDWSFEFHRLESSGDSRVDEVLHNPAYTVVVKSDLLRLAVLCIHGGLYVDTDFECLGKFDRFVEDTRGCFFGMEPGEILPSPALIGAAPGHPFIHAYLDEALKSLSSVSAEDANRKTHIVTGPHCMKRAVDASRHLAFTAHPSGLFYPQQSAYQASARHHWNHVTGGHLGWGRLRVEPGYAGIDLDKAPSSLFGKP